MRIQVKEVGATTTATGKNNKPYKVFTLTFYNNGKIMEKKITQYSDVFKTLSDADAEGKTFEITTQQNGQYTEWVAAGEVEGDANPAPKGKSAEVASDSRSTKTSSTKSTYETPEERAARQRYIVRQSSIANAIALQPKASAQDILELAEVFTDFVFEVEPLEQASDVIRAE